MIALDYGLKRLGLAWNAAGIILPLPAIKRINARQAASELDKILAQKRAQILIIGVANDEMRLRIQAFSKRLDFNGRIELIDESLSSKEAEEFIKNYPNAAKLRKNGKLDSLAAMIILERYLKKSL